jgi:iron complex outermembrane receptor protein
MKKLVLVIIIICNVLVAKAQYSLSGTVTENTDQTVNGMKLSHALGGVAVICDELNKSVLTDSMGRFAFHNVSKGVYILHFKRTGYQSFTEAVTVSDGDQMTFVTLVSSSLNLGEVVITGDAGSVREHTLAVDRIDAREIHIMGTETVMEALARLPGISQITTGNGVSRPVIRGMTTNRIVTLVNGIKLENQQWDLEHTLGLNEFGIDHIEVIKGPRTVQYGSDAMGGVLNFVDEANAPVGTVQADVNAGLHSNNLGNIEDLGVKGTNDKFSWRFRAGTSAFADYYNGANERVANSRFSEQMVKGAVGYNTSKWVSELVYQYNNGTYGIIEPFEKPGAEKEHYAFDLENPYHTYSHNMAVWKNTLFLGPDQLKVTLGYQNNQRRELEPADPERHTPADTLRHTFLGFNLNTYTANAAWVMPIRENTKLTIGAQAESQNNNNTGYGRLIPDATQTDLSGYALFEQHSNATDLSLGLRYDTRHVTTQAYSNPDTLVNITKTTLVAIDRTFSNISEQAGFTWHPGNHFAVNANAGTGYRAPNYAELTSNGILLETQRAEIGNPAFKKETNLQGEVNPVFQAADFRVEGSVFYNAIQNYIYLAPTTEAHIDGYPVYRYYQNNASIYGAEYRINIQPHQMKWFEFLSSFSYLIGKKDSGGYLPFMPAPKFDNEVTIKLKDKGRFTNNYFRVGVLSVLAQNHPAVNELSTPGYNLLDAGIGSTVMIWKHPVQVMLAGNNLLNTKYYDHLSRLRIYGVYGMGTDIFLDVRIPLSFKL